MRHARHRRWGSWFWMVLTAAGFLAAVTSAEVGAADPPQALEQAHWRNGRAYCDGQWVPIPDLLKSLRQARAAAEPVLTEKKKLDARVAEINKTLAKLLADYRAEAGPLERQKAQAEARKRLAMQALSKRPPAPPKKIQVRGRGRGRSNIGDINRRREEAYQQAKQRYEQMRTQASAALQEAQRTIAECEAKLKLLRAQLDTERKPLLEERTQATAKSRDLQRKVAGHVLKASRISAALLRVPESFRRPYGAVEWKGAIYSIEELEKMHEALVAEIKAEREKKAQEFLAQGRTLPATWRHPRQVEADALKAKIAEAKQAKSAVLR